jgi:hypothetical protein
MKRIILDYFRRWWLVLTAILIAYFAFQAFSIHENSSQTPDDQIVASVQHTINTIHNTFIFPILMVLGFLLMWDIQRGLARVLTSMPVTTRQIGRAWWMASVALPAMALGVIGLFALLLFASRTNAMISLENYLMGWILATLYLGAIFGALTFMTTTIPDTFADRIRTLLPNSLFALTIFGFMFLKLETLTMTQTMLIFATYVILSVLGWFRSERMVLQRAGFRPAAQHSQKQPVQHKIPQGFGGLPFLWQSLLIRLGYFGLAFIGWMILTMILMEGMAGRLPRSPGQFFEAATPGISTFFYFFIYIFVLLPVVVHLRFLRTLPISISALAATLVFFPVGIILAIGLVFTAFVGGFPTSCLIGVSLAAICVPLMIWHGSGTGTYSALVVLVMVTSLAPMFFHTTKIPPIIGILISIFVIVLAWEITRRLLRCSSKAYHVQPMALNAWGMAR